MRTWAVRVGLFAVLALMLAMPSSAADSGQVLKFVVTLAPSLQTGKVTGRLLVVISTTNRASELSQMNSVTNASPFFGTDVSSWKPGTMQKIAHGDDVNGYPLAELENLPAGDYFVQAFFNVYTQFNRSDGSSVWLHMPCGDGGSGTSSPGNLFSAVVPLHLDGEHSGVQQLTLNQMIPYPAGTTTFPQNDPTHTCQQNNYADTDHLKHIKIQSPLLSAFWGKPIYIGANVLLPMTYGQPGHENDHYPVVYDQGHWPGGGVLGFSETSSTGFSAYWKDPSTPQFIAVTIRHENPYYDDSYAVNSANLGPWGDAITKELIPYIDSTYRTYPSRWARTLTGGSTGGWEALAQMIFYPDVYDGTWAISPDPPDFRNHQLVNVYSDANAYFQKHQWVSVPRLSQRVVSGDSVMTMEEENHWELALGTHGRSQSGQWDVWQAVYGPEGSDGYPAVIWNKQTGDIDHAVATQWQPKDLRLYVTGNWATLGPKLTGRIHDYGGTADSFFLNEASLLFQNALAALTNPPANADFQWVERGAHGASPYTTQQLLTIMYNAMWADAPCPPKC
jgi:Putative esterase